MLILTTLTTLLTGLMAGLYLGWGISVLPGLWKLDHRTMLITFQQLNRSILNLPFQSLFVLTVLASPLLLALHWSSGQSNQILLLIGASLLVVVGHLLITLLGNIPINQQLDRMDLASASETELLTMTHRLRGPWQRFHWVRTIATVAAFVALLLLIAA